MSKIATSIVDSRVTQDSADQTTQKSSSINEEHLKKQLYHKLLEMPTH